MNYKKMYYTTLAAKVLAEGKAAQHKELLQRWEKQTKRCVFCNGWLTWIGDKKPDKAGHAFDCELAEELGDV